jgi:release factor glutamine methyltransferase
MISLIKKYSEKLASLYDSQQQREQIVWWMVEAITGKKQIELLVLRQPLSSEHIQILNEWIEKHCIKKMPLQYLIGSVPFADCTIFVEPPILIPRPETEEWVCALSAKLQKLPDKKIRILDLCTGSGAIALALGKALPEATIIGSDISQQALMLAEKNKQYNAVTNVTFIQSDLFDAFEGMRKKRFITGLPRPYFVGLAMTQSFDLIVCNPPYISHEEWKHLDPMVKEWEDYHALVACGEQGLGLIEKIVGQAPLFLKQNKQLLHHALDQLYIEIGYQQGALVENLMKKEFCHVAILKDYAGKDRVVAGGLGACGTNQSLLT